MNHESADLEKVLRERFGLADFHPWQREALGALLDGPGRVLVIAPTGGGKSLTYQLPAVVLPGTTLVISPLVALMEDQVRALERRGIPSTFLAATLDPDERRAREQGLREGRYKLVYAAPERLPCGSFVDSCRRSCIHLVAVDEAHCISMWGHDFRPDYLRIGDLLAALGEVRVLACTATATPAVRREIVERLGLADRPVHEVLRGFARPNLQLAARSVDGRNEARQTVLAELRRVLGSPAHPRGAAIVYAATRRGTEVLAGQLAGHGWNAVAYHAGLDGERRSQVTAGFLGREIDLVVATNAFGMGIDRPDIRSVIHAQPPGSIEAYYQEVGRAGRDGREAHGLLLCSGPDIALRRRMCALGGDGQPADPAAEARAWGLFCGLLGYLDACTCRHDYVLRHFGDEREALGGCGHCDVCRALELGGDPAASDPAEATRVVRMALSAVARAHGRAGLKTIGEMLGGTTNTRVERFGFTRLSTFGLLRGHSSSWILAVLRGLIAAGWVDLTASERPVPVLSAAGWAALRAQEPLPFQLPHERGALRPEALPIAAAAGPYDAALFARLRAHRNEVARRKGLPAYVVAFDRSLEVMAARRPRALGEMDGIPGFGPARVEHYGPGFLAVLAGGDPAAMTGT